MDLGEANVFGTSGHGRRSLGSVFPVNVPSSANIALLRILVRISLVRRMVRRLWFIESRESRASMQVVALCTNRQGLFSSTVLFLGYALFCLLRPGQQARLGLFLFWASCMAWSIATAIVVEC